MDTIQIMEICRKLVPLKSRFQGVFPLDRINKINLKRNHSYIINTAPSTHKGEHWVAVYFNGNRIEYFDSYGNKPKREIEKWIREKRTKYIHNKRQVQGPLQATCGAHCIYYLYHRSQNVKMKEITAKQNDEKVTDFVNSLYSPDDELENTFETESVNQIAKMFNPYV